MKPTIRSSADVSRVFAHGKRAGTPYATLLVLEREDSLKQEDGRGRGAHGRVAFVAGKKLGGAVWRNAAKRRMRAMCRDLGGPWPGYDVVFCARSGILKAPYSKVRASCERALSKQSLRVKQADQAASR